MTSISTDRFDGGKVWKTLTPAAQAIVGALALELAAANALAAAHQGPAGRAADEAARIAANRLDEEAFEEIGPLLATDAGHVHLPTCVGLVCHRCGCSQEDPCDEGCGWHDTVTCTACA